MEIALEILKASTPIVIGALGFYIARRQYYLAKLKYKYDLFDKRLAIFSEVTDLFYKISRTQIDESDSFFYNKKYKSEYRGALFIFNEEINNICHDIFTNAELVVIQYNYVNELRAETPPPYGDEREFYESQGENIRRREEKILHCHNEVIALYKVFCAAVAPFMTLTEGKTP